MSEYAHIYSTASNPSKRLQAGFRLHYKYGVPHTEIAALLGLREHTYLNRLRRQGIDPSQIPRGSQLSLDGHDILMNIHAELRRLTQGGNKPDKRAIDALTSLARALKMVHGLTHTNAVQSATHTQEAAVFVTPNELREALERIDRRINELADVRAAEIIRHRLDGQTNCGGKPGVDL